jgi:hypothetical protein
MLPERRRILIHFRRNQVISNDVKQKLKPEQRESSEYRAFARHRFLHHDVESRDAIGGDDQQFVFNCINVPDLSSSEEFGAGDAGLGYYVNRPPLLPRFDCQQGWNCATDEQGFVMASRIIDVTRFDVKHVLPQDELLW